MVLNNFDFAEFEKFDFACTVLDSAESSELFCQLRADTARSPLFRETQQK